MKRAFTILVVALSSAYIGFLVSGFVAARAVGADEFGLAPAATVVTIAIAGGAIALIASIFLASQGSQKKLTAWAIALPVLAVVLHLAVSSTRTRATLPPPATPAAAASDDKPPLPQPGAVDSLRGLVAMPADSIARFETKEIEYEVPAVTVYRQSSNWYLVGLAAGGREWIDSRTVGAFHPLGKILVDRLNYLTDAWDKRLRSTADSASAVQTVNVTVANNSEIPARVVEAVGSGPGLVLRVELYDKSPCEGGDDPKVIATGWIPAWNREGKVNAWFYSRGC